MIGVTLIPERSKQVRLIIVDGDRTGAPFVDHCEVLKKCSTNQRAVPLSSSSQLNACERAINRKVQSGDVNLCQIDISHVLSGTTRYRAAVHKRQFERRCQQVIDAAFRSPRVNQGLKVCHCS